MRHYIYNDQNIYCGYSDFNAQPNSTQIEPPIVDGFVQKFQGGQWVSVEDPIILEKKLSQKNDHGVALFVESNGIAIPNPNLEQETDAKLLRSFKNKRNSLLANSDFMMLPDAPQYIKDKLPQIISYRQALRDLPENTDYKNPIFPVNPLEG